jgi:hypothetical protein
MGISRTLRACVLVGAALLGAGCGHKDNFAPYALDQTIALPAGDTIQAQLQGQRLNANTASYMLVTLPADGAVSLESATGLFNYTPAPGFIGNDSFTWQASDNDGTTNVATVTIEVVAAVAMRGSDVGPAHRLAARSTALPGLATLTPAP